MCKTRRKTLAKKKSKSKIHPSRKKCQILLSTVVFTFLACDLKLNFLVIAGKLFGESLTKSLPPPVSPIADRRKGGKYWQAPI